MTVWDFLNSSFGLWVLSSVLLASLSKLFLIWKESSSRRAAARSEADDLLFEIEVRTQPAIRYAENSKTVHLADDGPLHGPISKYNNRSYLQLLIEAECRLENRITTGALTDMAAEIAQTNTSKPDEVTIMIAMYKEILAAVRTIRLKG